SLLAAEAQARGGWQAIDLTSIDAGLAGIFEGWWREQERAWHDGTRTPTRVTERVLSILACALAPLPVAILAAVAGEDADVVTHALAPLGRFVVANARGDVAFAHPRLGHYFRDKLGAEERARLDRAFADATRRIVAETFADGKVAPPPYVLSTHV